LKLTEINLGESICSLVIVAVTRIWDNISCIWVGRTAGTVETAVPIIAVKVAERYDQLL